MRRLRALSRRRGMSMLSMVVVSAFLLIGADGCDDDNGDEPDENRVRSVQSRQSMYARAVARHPDPTNLVNFPIRGALVKFTERQDLENHPWYIYILGWDGTYLGYFVGTVYPVNACNFLGSTEQIVQDENEVGGWVVTAPSYDGIFYGGSGASGACDVYFTFDVATDTMITFNMKFLAFDAPLVLPGVEQLQVQSSPAASPAPAASIGATDDGSALSGAGVVPGV